MLSLYPVHIFFLCVDNTALFSTFCICQNISSFIHLVSGVMSVLMEQDSLLHHTVYQCLCSQSVQAAS